MAGSTVNGWQLTTTDGIMCAVTLLLLVFGALVWADELYKDPPGRPRGGSRNPFPMGTLQVISAYPCDANCTVTTEGDPALDTIGECYEGVYGDEIPLLDAAGQSLGNQTVGRQGMTQGPAMDVACQVQDRLCFLMRNTGSSVVRMSDLGSAYIYYELPDDPQLGEMELYSEDVGASFDYGSGNVCCRLGFIAMNGRCGLQKSIAPRETFILAFNGDYEDATGALKPMTYFNVNRERMIISINLPSGFLVSHQIV
ncbi:MAG: hypothetical protein QGG50_06445 [Methanopyri archaeon]|nr:hypothetical protein [Methanopyri archaeon]